MNGQPSIAVFSWIKLRILPRVMSHLDGVLRERAFFLYFLHIPLFTGAAQKFGKKRKTLLLKCKLRFWRYFWGVIVTFFFCKKNKNNSSILLSFLVSQWRCGELLCWASKVKKILKLKENPYLSIIWVSVFNLRWQTRSTRSTTFPGWLVAFQWRSKKKEKK